MCVAAAGGVLGSLGIATIGLEPWFVPVIAFFLMVGLWGFWQLARVHRQWHVLIIATISSIGVIGGRFFNLPYLLWLATAALLVAYVLDVVIKAKNSN